MGGVVYDDGNDNAVRDPGETLIASRQVRLWQDTNNDGVCTDGVDAVIGTTTTDSKGSYGFQDVPAGTYCVQVTGQAGTAPTFSAPVTLSGSAADQGAVVDVAAP
jgi:hypothetical protein